VPTISWLNIPHLDKIIHNIIFFSLSASLYIWLAAAFPPIKKKGVIVMILILVGYGIAIEFIQDNLIEGRSFEIKDILADTSGCLIFFICYLIYRRC
jgi:VanZ family protein